MKSKGFFAMILIFYTFILTACTVATEDNGEYQNVEDNNKMKYTVPIVSYDAVEDVSKQEGIFTVQTREGLLILKIPLKQIESNRISLNSTNLRYYYDTEEDLERIKKGIVIEEDEFKIVIR